MQQGGADERLSQISTLWSLVCQAHQGKDEVASEAQLRLLQRYGGAVRRYLLGGLRDADAAEELSQEFALRFIRGDFHKVTPARGRFRNYVKAVLFRMVASFHREQKGKPLSFSETQELPSLDISPEQEQAFQESWRAELLSRAWTVLADREKQGGRPNHTVLQLRLVHPQEEMTSARFAELLGGRLGKEITAAHARKLLQRARAEFARLLLEDVRESLEEPTPETLEQELRLLGLWTYCQPALPPSEPGGT